MAKVITFSRQFPAYHPRAGEPTYFVEQIIKGLPYSLHDDSAWGNIELCKKLVLAIDIWKDLGRKYHTIRAGHRWKAGDWFSPRVWLGKPYNSKMIQFAPDIQIKKTFDFCVDLLSGEYTMDGIAIDVQIFKEIAKNDGLTATELSDWFNQPMTGQIICWNENIEY